MARRRTGHIGMSEQERAARRNSIGGSDVRIIMSGDEEAIHRLWLEKRGEVVTDNFGDTLLGAYGNLLEPLNTDWFEQETGWFIANEQKKVHHPDVPYIHSTLDGLIYESELAYHQKQDPLAVFE